MLEVAVAGFQLPRVIHHQGDSGEQPHDLQVDKKHTIYGIVPAGSSMASILIPTATSLETYLQIPSLATFT